MAEAFPERFESWTKPRKLRFAEDFGLELRSGVTSRSTVPEIDRAIRAAWERQYTARASRFLVADIRASGVLDVPPQAVVGAVSAGLLQEQQTIEEAAAAVEAYLGQEVRS